ncbi:FecCD family ABC transporter permease [uncultured Friedmanniella sp.]|uniref:FecCD family ABC transporter permease n=1 Tax=uncultured Friedmanniella sp. TaxID=335381 RepID=UPI0035CAC3C2
MSPAAATAVPTRPATPTPSRRRTLPLGVVLGLALLGVAAAVVASFVLGARPTAWSTVVQTWTDPVAGDGDQAVVLARAPRTVAGLLVGAALGLAGTAMQGVTRNPLGDPGILGVNAGAALAVVTGIEVFGVADQAGFVWFALVGAGVAAVVVYGVASMGRGGATPVKLALAGAAVSAGLFSVLNGVLVASTATWDTYRFWAVGAVAGRSWEQIAGTAPFLAVGAALALGTGSVLNGLALGDDLARGLGQRVALGRAVTALGAVLLCGAATALAGPIAFVGLVVPHVARLLVGPDFRRVLPLSMLLGAILLLGADVVGRLLQPPGEVPAGLLTALLGAPVLVWLVRRRRAVTG